MSLSHSMDHIFSVNSWKRIGNPVLSVNKKNQQEISKLSLLLRSIENFQKWWSTRDKPLVKSIKLMCVMDGITLMVFLPCGMCHVPLLLKSSKHDMAWYGWRAFELMEYYIKIRVKKGGNVKDYSNFGVKQTPDSHFNILRDFTSYECRSQNKEVKKPSTNRTKRNCCRCQSQYFFFQKKQMEAIG